MGNRILSIRSDDGLLQAAEIARSRGGSDVVYFRQERVKEGRVADDFADELRKKSAAARVCVCVPSEEIVFRVVHLPFSQEDRVAAAMRFEAEKHLPFNVEDSIYDYAFIEKRKNASTLLLAGARRDVLESHAAALRNAGVKPDLISPDLVCTAALTGESPGASILVEPREEGSRLAVVKKGFPLLVRPSGAGPGAPDLLAGDAEMLAGVFSLREPGERIAGVFVAGEQAGCGALAETLSRKLGIEAALIDPLEGFGRRPEGVENAGAGLFALMGGARIIGPGRQAVNLKETKRKSRRLSSAAATAVLGALVVLLSAGAVFLNYRGRQEYLSYLEKEIRETAASISGDEIPGGRTGIEMISILRTRITDAESEKKALDEVGSASVLEVLREINLRLGPEVPVEITNIRIDRGVCHIDGRVGTFRRLEEVFGLMSDSEYFISVKIARAQADSARGGVVFRLRAEYPDSPSGARPGGS